MMRITVLGLGSMGTALASTLLARGHRVAVWNRTAAKTEPLVQKGAVRAERAAEAVAAGDLILACLLDYGAVYETLEGAQTALAGRSLVNLTNGTPEQARAMARWVEGGNCRYLDGGIMAVPPMIGGPEVFLLYSGSKAAFDLGAECLRDLGAAHYLGSDPGHASLYDLALLTAMYGLFGGFLQAAAMLVGENLKAEGFLPLAVPWLNAMTGALPELAEQIDSSDYAADGGSNLAMQVVALDNIVAANEEMGLSNALIAPLRALMHRRVEAGFGGDELSGLIELLDKRRDAVAGIEAAYSGRR